MTKAAVAPKKHPPLQRSDFVCSLEATFARNYFYRDCYRRMLLICLTLIILMGGLLYGLRYEFTHQNYPRYFATTPDTTPIPIVPLSQPNLQPAFLLEWAIEAATSSFTFNFVDYRRSLQTTRTYFTRDGYQKFLKALKESNDLEAVKTKKLVVYAKLEENSNPTILSDSSSDPNLRINGAYTWQVQIPMLVTYEGAGQNKIVQRVILTMLVRRMSTLESPKGVGIESFVVREITG